MRRAARIPRHRNGIATLELVLVFPMLLATVAGLFLIARADVAKVRTATDARRQTWQGRAGAPAGQRLRPFHNPQDSEISSLPPRDVPLRPLFPGPPRQARSGNALIGNSWDARAIPFPALAKNMRPHTSVLSLIGSDVSVWMFDSLAAAFDPGTNPVLVAANAAGRAENVGIGIDGDILEFTFGAAFNVQIKVLNFMWDALEDSTFGLAGLTSEGKKIKKALNYLESYLNCFHNLYEASHGRPGDDPGY